MASREGPFLRYRWRVFGIFKKPPKPTVLRGPDQVFLTAAARTRALARALRDAGGPAVVVTPFRGHLGGLKAALEGLGLEVEVPGESYRERAAGQGASLLVDPKWLRSAAASFGGEPVEVLQAERHPLRAHDEAIEEAVASLPAGSGLRVFLALDEGLLGLFGGSLQDLFRRLSVPEDEPIESPMVSDAIQNAQEKIRKAVAHEAPADTFEAFQARNLKP